MPSGIYKHKSNQGFQKGNNTGGAFKHKVNKGSFQKGHKLSKKARKKISLKNKGKHPSKATRKKMSERMKGDKNLNFGIHRYGSESLHWKGGITPENKMIRSSTEYKLWRKSCFERDNFTCQKYGIRGGKLVVHHINNFADFPELRLAIDNGITLSTKAHKEFHRLYGNRNNTKEQLIEFLKN